MPQTSLSFFPGMPFLTYRVGRRLQRFAPGMALRLEVEPPQFRTTTDREVYTVYAGEVPIGRFTIRQTGTEVERVFLCIVPATSPVPSVAVSEGKFAEAGPVWEDALRIASESIRLWAFRAMGERKSLLSKRPWRALADTGHGNRMSLLAMMSAFPETGPLRHAHCDLDGKPFVVMPIRMTYNSPTNANEQVRIDVGGLCITCQKLLCPDHLRFDDQPDDSMRELNAKHPGALHAWVLVCEKDGTNIAIPAKMPTLDDITRELREFIERMTKEE